MRRLGFLLALIGASAGARDAAAFCGFYVSGADTKLYNNATQVVMMRDGTRTVLAMQNNYQGPPENFAMVVPVPVILQKENVKTLPHDVFDKVDQLDAPRLVEYWEQDPCAPQMDYEDVARSGAGPVMAPMAEEKDDSHYGVKVEARFTVGEYDIVILSAQFSGGLDAWLRDNGYKIPEGAEPYLRPYVRSGSKFFVAKVDVTKVTFKDGMAALSPLRFHYDSDEFTLPIRLGLMNSGGTQDLIVHILSRGQRYEVANYDNVTIPTNLDVADDVRTHYGAFYASLFDRTLETHPFAVVTEYSWDAGSCDPCPVPPLEGDDVATLGADALPNTDPYGFVLTRLHARYGKDSAGDDLVFRAAFPIMGGRETTDETGHIEKRARPSGYNNFQGRYVIRHQWTGPIACANPRRGIWGGPPAGDQIAGGQTPPVMAARDLAFAPRGSVELASEVREDVPEIGVKQGVGARPTPTLPTSRVSQRGCACEVGARAGGSLAAGALGLIGLALLRRRRRR